MKRKVAFILLGLPLVAVVGLFGWRWYEETEVQRILNCMDGAFEYSYVNVEGAHIGDVDFVTTPSKVYQQYGEPASTLEGNWRKLPNQLFFDSAGIVFKVWGDTLRRYATKTVLQKRTANGCRHIVF